MNGDHGCKYRADEVQEIGNIPKGQEDRPQCTDDRNGNGDPLAADFGREGFTGNTCGIGIEEGGGNGGKDDDEEACHTETCLDHDLGNIGLPCKDSRAHTDHIHPAANYAVGHGADGRGLDGLLRLAGIVADEGQPREGHGNRQLHGSAEGHALAGDVQAAAVTEDHKAENDGQDEQRTHGDGVDLAQVLDADHDPKDDQSTDDETPHPVADGENAVDRQCAVVDHNARPAHKLEDIQHREKQCSLAAKAHFHRFHGAFAYFAANEPREEQHGTADDMTQQNGEQALRKAEGGEISTRQNLGDGDGSAEPNKAVFKNGSASFLHLTAPPFHTRPAKRRRDPWAPNRCLNPA